VALALHPTAIILQQRLVQRCVGERLLECALLTQVIDKAIDRPTNRAQVMIQGATIAALQGIGLEKPVDVLLGNDLAGRIHPLGQVGVQMRQV